MRTVMHIALFLILALIQTPYPHQQRQPIKFLPPRNYWIHLQVQNYTVEGITVEWDEWENDFGWCGGNGFELDQDHGRWYLTEPPVTTACLKQTNAWIQMWLDWLNREQEPLPMHAKR